MEYHTFYDISQSPEAYFSLLPYYLLLVCAISIYIYAWRTKWKRIAFQDPLGLVGFAIAQCIIHNSLNSVYYDYRQNMLTRELLGQSETIEGTVYNFTASVGDKIEHFCVKDRCFKTERYFIGPRAPVVEEGSPVKDGLFLRVTYVNGTHIDDQIVKLEVYDTNSKPPRT